MAVRIREERKNIVCAAESRARKGDCYLNDDVHYTLVVEMKVLHTDDKGETWYFKGGVMNLYEADLLLKELDDIAIKEDVDIEELILSYDEFGV